MILLNVRENSWNKDDVDRTVAHYLIRNAQPVAVGIQCIWHGVTARDNGLSNLLATFMWQASALSGASLEDIAEGRKNREEA